MSEATLFIKDLSAKKTKLEKENQNLYAQNNQSIENVKEAKVVIKDLTAKNQSLQTKLNQANNQIDNLTKVKALEHEKMRKYRDTIMKYKGTLKRKRDQCQTYEKFMDSFQKNLDIINDYRNKCNKKQKI